MAERARPEERARSKGGGAHGEPQKGKRGQGGKHQVAADVVARRILHHEKGHGGGGGAGGPVRVLVTGYGSFMGIEDNPSAAIAEKLASVKIPGALIKTKVLPVTWK